VREEGREEGDEGWEEVRILLMKTEEERVEHREGM
jgi:hypothetical protein